jgi:hypothetical protein
MLVAWHRHLYMECLLFFNLWHMYNKYYWKQNFSICKEGHYPMRKMKRQAASLPIVDLQNRYWIMYTSLTTSELDRLEEWDFIGVRSMDEFQILFSCEIAYRNLSNIRKGNIIHYSCYVNDLWLWSHMSSLHNLALHIICTHSKWV